MIPIDVTLVGILTDDIGLSANAPLPKDYVIMVSRVY